MIDATFRVVIMRVLSTAVGRWDDPIVGSRRGAVFSETARLPADASPRPPGGHLPAVRRRERLVAASIARRRLADDLAERAAERAEAREPHVEADVGDAAAGLAEQEHRTLDAPALEVAM